MRKFLALVTVLASTAMVSNLALAKGSPKAKGRTAVHSVSAMKAKATKVATTEKGSNPLRKKTRGKKI